jgi:PEP-CTERM motif
MRVPTNFSRMWMLSAAVIFVGAILAAPAYAIPLAVTFTPDTSNLVLTEGDTGITDTFTINITDISGLTYEFYALDINPGSTTGDSTDVPSSLDFTTTSGTCDAFDFSLNDGDSCTEILTVNTDQDAGETPTDSGTSNYTARLYYNTYNGGVPVGVSYWVDAPFSVTVNDAPVSAPEPSSLLLLGFGLLGLVAVGARGKRHAAAPAN